MIYALSPGGVEASARRTSSWIGEIRRAAERHGVDPARLEAIVFLESAGRPEVIAGKTPEAASGLAQIIPSTATDLLGMEVDLERSIALTKEIGKAERKGELGQGRAAAPRARRGRRALRPRGARSTAPPATWRSPRSASERSDLATVSYHMGIGNLESVIRAYTGASERRADRARSSPPRTSPTPSSTSTRRRTAIAEAHELLSGFGDDSSEYFWKVLASRADPRARRAPTPTRSQRTADLATAKATLEEVYHPEDETRGLRGPGRRRGRARRRRPG